LNADNPSYWIVSAEDDIQTANWLFKGGRYLHMAFFCHLVIEKSLKALIAKPGEIPPRIHNLMRLAELGGLEGSLSDEQLAILNELFPMNLEARYPSEQFEMSHMMKESYCKSLLTRTEDLFKWIKSRL
jgi:HEPN domain-containing protein